MGKRLWIFLLCLFTLAAVHDRRIPGASGAPLLQSARVVAIGDIHGDFDAFVGILERAQLVDTNRKWSGRNTTLVQTGDFLDRGPKTRAVIDLLMALQKDAPRQGSRVIVLMGNHEAMNIYGDLRYVTPGDYAGYVDNRSENRRKSAYGAFAAMYAKAPPLSEDEWMKLHPPGFIEHREAFGPDGRYGKWLRTLPAVARVDDSIFLHGGIHPDFASWTVDKINEGVRAEVKAFDAYKKFMVDEKIALPFFTLDELASVARTAVEKKFDALKDFIGLGGWLSIHPDGPLWFRGYAEWTDAEGAPRIQRLAEGFGVSRFVVGHTPQAGRIAARFGGKVYLIDTGMLSSYYAGGRATALNIQDGKVSEISEQGNSGL
ncbi:MAG TPA: metallophosphoesterase [Terriglobia bacterium]|nr:metallophosphoesterase [Terriglobia bacterium]